MTRWQAMVAVALVLGVGEAAAVQSLRDVVTESEGGQMPAASSPTPCLPPGVPALSGLVEVVVESGEPYAIAGSTTVVPARVVVYGRPGVDNIPRRDYQPALIVGIWIGAVLAVVDPQPFDPDAPAWIDRGVLTADGEYLVPDWKATCRWEREHRQPWR